MTSHRSAARRTTTLTALALALSMSLLLSSCQKDAAEQAETASTEAPLAEDASTRAPETETGPATEPAAEAVVTPAAQPLIVPGTDAAIIQDRSDTVTAAPGFDSKHFAGMYVDGDTVLEVTDDGLFVLNISGDSVEGTWSAQAGGKTVLLDPNSKGQQDRTVKILSADSVKIDGGATMQRHHGGH